MGLRNILAGFFAILWRFVIPCLPAASIRALARLLFSKSWRTFVRATRDPRRAQEAILLGILSRNQDTVFGREHDFRSIRSIPDFQKRVPILGYEQLEGYIERMTTGENKVLTADPVSFFARTSGTTGAAKLIPVTKRFLQEYRWGRRAWARQVAQEFPGLVRGILLTIQSPRIEGRTPAGIPYGSITVAMGGADQGLTGQVPVVEPFQKIPLALFFIEDFNSKYYALLRMALAARISMMAAVNPSTLILICRKLTEFAPDLINDCIQGTLKPGLKMDESLRLALQRKLRPDPNVAQRLRQSLQKHSRVRPVDVWPSLCGLLCWKGGAAPFYLQQFPKWFGDLPVMDFGFAATEGNFSVVLGAQGSKGVAAVSGHFMEFVPENHRQDAAPPVFTADQLKVGQRYYILVTASNGLVRYDMNDVVEVVGMYNQTPEITFCHKGGNMISITGEKVGESHVVQAMAGALAESGMSLHGFCVTVRLDQETPRYLFAVETENVESNDRLLALLEACDRHLRLANIEYDAKRMSQRLGHPLLALVSSGAFERLRQQKIAAGAFDAHVKNLHLSANYAAVESLGIIRILESPLC